MPPVSWLLTAPRRQTPSGVRLLKWIVCESMFSRCWSSDLHVRVSVSPKLLIRAETQDGDRRPRGWSLLCLWVSDFERWWPFGDYKLGITIWVQVYLVTLGKFLLLSRSLFPEFTITGWKEKGPSHSLVLMYLMENAYPCALTHGHSKNPDLGISKMGAGSPAGPCSELEGYHSLCPHKNTSECVWG